MAQPGPDMDTSRGPWELLDGNGIFHFVPGIDELKIVQELNGLHWSDLRKLVGLEHVQ